MLTLIHEQAEQAATLDKEIATLYTKKEDNRPFSTPDRFGYILGGMPRDHAFGEPARDIDYFVSVDILKINFDIDGEVDIMSKGLLISALKTLGYNKVEEIKPEEADCPYTGNNVIIVYELSDHPKFKTPVNIIVVGYPERLMPCYYDCFPCNLSKAEWTRTGGYKYAKEFMEDFSSNYITYIDMPTEGYEKKMKKRFPNRIARLRS